MRKGEREQRSEHITRRRTSCRPTYDRHRSESVGKSQPIAAGRRRGLRPGRGESGISALDWAVFGGHPEGRSPSHRPRQTRSNARFSRKTTPCPLRFPPADLFEPFGSCSSRPGRSARPFRPPPNARPGRRRGFTALPRRRSRIGSFPLIRN
jgi:hypothetical protein